LRGEEVQSDGSGKVEVDEDEGSRGSRSISFSSFACFYDRILSIFVFHERFYPFPCPISLIIVTLAFLLLYWCIALWYYCLFGVFCVEMRLEAGNLEQHTWGRGYEIERSSLPKRKARTILYLRRNDDREVRECIFLLQRIGYLLSYSSSFPASLQILKARRKNGKLKVELARFIAGICKYFFICIV
jgi:hypothetical protein